ncbi:MULTISPECIES: acyl-CoA dehydrogenase [Streptomyces]|uniref:acyl-CoA dehydrogenase n=1 Tax=Streptomyces TaxID=1883 RepID=UPI0023DD05A6|nr:acyl-CoA dehydrogenase [Streptomyces sp. FXJ1.172]WEP00551.1 acyl-CoA dehydrogenase [Streptomyces sp. FXJ1.172]
MVNDLTDIIYDGRFERHYMPVQLIFADPEFKMADGLSLPARAINAYGMLKHAAFRLGKSSDVVRDPGLLLAFYEWASTHAPDLLPLISGHYNLTTGLLLDLGQRSPELHSLLEDLDTAQAVGVLLINEFGCGSNVAFLETTATYEHTTRSFRLDTPRPEARKFMPNVGAPIPRVTVVAARLMVDGVQHGVFPFVTRLRDRDGKPAEGVTIMPMPDKPFFPMDNAVTDFCGVSVPFSGWLAAGIAEIDEAGVFRYLHGHGPRDAFRKTASQFTFGRVALSSAAVASARAAVLLFARYAQSREIQAFHGHRRPMLEFRNLQRSLFGALATTYACSFFTNTFKSTLVHKADLSAPETQLAGIVAKSYLVPAAHRVLREARARCGAHAMFSANRIADYLGLCEGSLTAEGDIQVMQLSAGRQLLGSKDYFPSRPAVPETEPGDDGDAYLAFFEAREADYYERASAVMRSPLGSGTTFDRWNRCVPFAMRLTDAYAHRLAYESLLAAVNAAPAGDPREALRLIARLFALEYISTHAALFLSEGRLTESMYARLDEEQAETCERLSPHLSLLVDAFAIDEDILAAPLTAPDRPAAWAERSEDVARVWKEATSNHSSA